MKRYVCMILAIALCLACLGCRSDQPKLVQPVNFYYRSPEPRYGEPNGIMLPLVTEADGRMEDPLALLNDYLRGPDEAGYESTFPASTKILSMDLSDGRVLLNMNDSLARFTGIDLTVACACLSLTAMELLDVSSVTIRCSNEQLDGAKSITMDQNTLTLLDLYTPETT